MRQHTTEAAAEGDPRPADRLSTEAPSDDTAQDAGDRLTADDLADLRRRYAPTEVPPCALCGGPLAISAIGGGEPTVYACENAGYGPGKRYDSVHYSASRWLDRRQGGDSRVMNLLAEVEQRRAQDAADVAGTTDGAEFPAQAGLVWPAAAVHRIGLALYVEPWPPVPEDDGWDAVDQWKAALCERLADVAAHARAAQPTTWAPFGLLARCGHSGEVINDAPYAQVRACPQGCPPEASPDAGTDTRAGSVR